MEEIPEPTGFNRLLSEIEAHDITWVAIPFSRAEIHRLAKMRGVLTPDAVFWQEIRESLGLHHKPLKWRGTHYAFHQGERPWLKEANDGRETDAGPAVGNPGAETEANRAGGS